MRRAWWAVFEWAEWLVGRVLCRMGRCNVSCRGRVDHWWDSRAGRMRRER